MGNFFVYISINVVYKVAPFYSPISEGFENQLGAKTTTLILFRIDRKNCQKM